jgi:cytochrome c553
MMYRFTVALALMVSPVAAQEAPPELMANFGGVSSQVAWTPETIALLRDADPARGAALHGDLLCSSCHGAEGVARSTNWPNLAGQVSGYIYKSLYDYHTWERTISEGGPLMGYLVEEMTPQDMADMAKYYASLPKPAAQDTALTQAEFDVADKLNWLGDPDRLVQPCSACHGNKGEGVFPDYPLISGQTEGYLREQLLLYKSGERHSDVYSRMRLISKELTDVEIGALAKYFAAMSYETGIAQASD